MGNTKKGTCINCGNPVWISRTNARSGDICCRPCRRSLTYDQKVSLGIAGQSIRCGVRFPSCVGCGQVFCRSVKSERAYCLTCRPIQEPKQPKPEGVKPRDCGVCGTTFTPHWHYAGARYCSESCSKARPVKVQQPKPKVPKPCAECGVVFTPRNRTHKLCSDACRMDRMLRRASLTRQELYGAYLDAIKANDVQRATDWIRALMRYLAERDGLDCGICGRKVRMAYKSGPTGVPSGLGPSVDHIIPRSVAPELASDLSNLRLTHWSCNRNRSTADTGTEQLALIG